MTLLHASVKALVRVDLLMYALPKHKHNTYSIENRIIPFSTDISWYSNLFETVETEGPWWIMCSYIRLGQSNRYLKKTTDLLSSTSRTWHPLIKNKTTTTTTKKKQKKKNTWKPKARNRTRPSFYACPGYQQIWWWSKKNELAWRHHFSIISLWEFF